MAAWWCSRWRSSSRAWACGGAAGSNARQDRTRGMKLARLLIAAAVLAGLGGLLWWSNRSEAAKAAKPDPKAAPKILELKEGDIRQIEIRHRDGETTVVRKDDTGKWSITAPQPLAADQTAVGSI